MNEGAESSIVTLSDAAINKVANILLGSPEKPHFRVQIKGGGCSGFEYIFGIDDAIQARDFYQKINNATHPFIVVVDAISSQYIQGASIDYVCDTNGARFVVSNPNAHTSCSCGSSFSITGDA